jgi:hypothetical protein
VASLTERQEIVQVAAQIARWQRNSVNFPSWQAWHRFEQQPLLNITRQEQFVLDFRLTTRFLGGEPRLRRSLSAAQSTGRCMAEQREVVKRSFALTSHSVLYLRRCQVLLARGAQPTDFNAFEEILGAVCRQFAQCAAKFTGSLFLLSRLMVCHRQMVGDQRSVGIQVARPFERLNRVVPLTLPHIHGSKQKVGIVAQRIDFEGAARLSNRQIEFAAVGVHPRHQRQRTWRQR